MIGGRGATSARRPPASSRSTSRTRRVRARRRARTRRAPTSPPVALGDRILLAGGRDAPARAATLGELAARARRDRAAAPAQRARRHATSTPTTARACSSRRGALRAAARLRAEQPEQHGRRDRPAHLQDRRALRGRRAAAARRAGVGPEDALRHERPRQQPHADRPAHRQARARRSRSTTRTTCTSRPTAATRSSSPSASTGSTSATRTRFSAAPLAARCRAPASTTWTSRPTARYLLASCEFSGQLIKVDVASERVVRHARPARRRGGMPQDVKLSPDGRIFYVADMHARRRLGGRRRAPEGARVPAAPAPARTASTRAATRKLPVRDEPRRGLDLGDQLPHAQGRRKWRIPGGGSPDMGGVSADGKVLWLSGRYNGVVYAISTRTRAAAREDPGRRGPARPLRLAAAGPLLARTHRRPALTVASLVC